MTTRKGRATKKRSTSTNVYSCRLDVDSDAELIALLSTIPQGRRSAAIREMLRKCFWQYGQQSTIPAPAPVAAPKKSTATPSPVDSSNAAPIPPRGRAPGPEVPMVNDDGPARAEFLKKTIRDAPKHRLLEARFDKDG